MSKSEKNRWKIIEKGDLNFQNADSSQIHISGLIESFFFLFCFNTTGRMKIKDLENK